MISANVSDALQALGVTEYVLRGEPTTEAEFNTMFTKVTGKDSDDVAIESSDPADFGVTWSQVETKKAELVLAKPLNEVRQVRDRLIAETDWWASSDLTMTAEQTAYRQALRDITDNCTGLDDVTWPTKP